MADTKALTQAKREFEAAEAENNAFQRLEAKVNALARLLGVKK